MDYIKIIKKTAGEGVSGRITGERKKRELKKVSPYHNVKNIKIPLLIFHGKNDPTAPIRDVEKFVKRLKKNKKKHDYVVFENEGRDLLYPLNRMKYLDRLAEFFATNLGEPVELDTIKIDLN